MTRYSFVRSLCAAILLIAPAIALSQAFPNHPIQFMVTSSAGGQPDVVARIVGKKMGELLGQPITVVDITGGGGTPAINLFRSSRPDGYSLIIIDAGHWAINPAARSNITYDPEKAFTPVGLITTSSLFLAVHSSVPANNLAELVALVKKNPGVYSYGSSGIGSLHQLTVESFKQANGLDIMHIPYRGAAQSVPALVGGQVHMVVSALNSLAPFEKDGRIKILGANTLARSALAPETPSMSSVVPGLDFPGQNGLLGPAGMPRDVVEKLAQALDTALNAPDVVAALRTVGVEPAATRGPEALADRMHSDRIKYGTLIKSLGIKLE